MTTFYFPPSRNYTVLWLANINHYNYGRSPLGILYPQYREVGRNKLVNKVIKRILRWGINHFLLAPLAVGQRAYVMVRCASVRPSICPCVNIFFKHLLLWNYLSDFDEISQKCSWHSPLQNLLKKFESFKNYGCHGNKIEKKMKTLKIFLSETMWPRATKFGM